MRYFLDFDKTLFDTDAFIEYLGKKIHTPELANLPLDERNRSVLYAYEARLITFEDGELSPFVYGDVAEFLRLAANNATIVTFGSPGLQKAKIQSALSHIPRVHVVYTLGKDKGPFVKEQLGDSGSEAVFVDDAILPLESVALSCPGVQLFEMRRDGGEGDGRWRVITSLYELP